MMPQDQKVTPKNSAGQDFAQTEGGEGVAPNFRGLKILVIALGVGIAGMLGLMVYTISQRAAESLMAEEQPKVVQPNQTPTLVEYGNFTLDRPEGSELVAVQADGANLVFHFSNSAGDIVIVLDRNTGKQTKVDVPHKWQNR